MSNEKVGLGLVCFLAGAAFGAAVGLLTAPQSGRRTRRMIERKAHEGRDYLMDLGEEITERGQEIYELGRQFANDTSRAVEKKIATVTAAAK